MFQFRISFLQINSICILSNCAIVLDGTALASDRYTIFELPQLVIKTLPSIVSCRVLRNLNSFSIFIILVVFEAFIIWKNNSYQFNGISFQINKLQYRRTHRYKFFITEKKKYCHLVCQVSKSCWLSIDRAEEIFCLLNKKLTFES